MKVLNFKKIHEWPLKKQMPIFAIIFLMVFLAGYQWDITNIQDKISSAADNELDLKQQMSMVIKKESELSNKLLKYPTLKKLVGEWQAKLINYSMLPSLLKDILKMGSNSNLYFSLFNPEDAVTQQGYVKVGINMILVGNYNQLGDFISQIANNDTIIYIKDFSISNENKADEIGGKLADIATTHNLLTTKMRLEIYMQPTSLEKK